MTNRKVYEYKYFQDIFVHTLNKHAPVKENLRFKHNSSMTKTLRKVIMHRYKLNMYIIYLGQLKFGNNESKEFLYKSSFKNYKRLFAKTTLNVNHLSDNKEFWEKIKPYFSNKSWNSNKILLKEKGRHISDRKKPEKLMNLSINITGELDLRRDTETFLVATITLDEVLEKFQYHPKIKQIRKTFNNNETLFWGSNRWR